MIRAVVDTNVWISALLSEKGAPAKILEALRAEKFTSLISPEITDEIIAVVSSEKIRNGYGIKEKDIEEILLLISVNSELIRGMSLLKIVFEDPADDRFITCAAAGAADYLVTGDKHLLKLREYQGIRILKPAPFLYLLESG